MNKMQITLIIFCLIAIQVFAGQAEDQLYNTILHKSFISDKIPVAEELGNMKTKNAREKLLQLLGDSSSWNREPAARGLFVMKDESLAPVLFDRMVSDHMINSVIQDQFIKHCELYFNFLSEKYKSVSEKNLRDKIIDIIGASRIQRGDRFLKVIIENENSDDREIAFKNLSTNFKNNNYQYIRKYKDESIFRIYALTFLMENGTADELAIFKSILENKEEPRYRLIAFRAVNKWDGDAAKHAAFLDALRSQDETLVQGGMFVFTSVRSDAVKTELCRLVKKGGSQLTRITAVLRLKDYTTTDIVPYFILGLREEYIQRERGGVDIFATVITLGIASIFYDINQKHKKRSFEDTKAEIAAYLKKITGADNGASYPAWSEWAIYNGYTVDGANIIQYLFSGYKSKREKAFEQSMKLLGYAGSRDFFAKNGNFNNDTDLALALAKMLAHKGFLKDE